MDKYQMQSVGQDWLVYETASDQVVKRTPVRADAVKFKKFSMSGGAFAGWTPAFILIDTKKITPLKNLDAELESVLASSA